MSKPAPTRYRTLNQSSYNASLRERRSLTVWLDPSTPWQASPSGKRGAQSVYSDAAIKACSACHCGRRPFGDGLTVARLLKIVGFD